MLERFYQYKQNEISQLKNLSDSGLLPLPFTGQRGDFKKSLLASPNNIAVIAEFKRASPSRGEICKTLQVEDAVCQYANNGADAISVLTEENWFAGKLDFIERAYKSLPSNKNTPILRKDFIFDPLQVLASAATPAAAILLIVRMINDVKKLIALQDLAAQYNLQCVVEVFDENDLKIARDAGASLIQVNARNLSSLKVDRQACLNLASCTPPEEGECWIAASGIDHPDHLRQAREAGFAAVLVGSFLMQNGKPGEALSSLLGYRHDN